MIQKGFESRVKVQQIIESQLPEFIIDESPKASEFLKQYYISQEYQGGTIDISDNLDQYLKLDNLTPEVVVGFTYLSSETGYYVSPEDDIILVDSTKGFPEKYGLLKIGDEIITYTHKTTTQFLGCVRGFSGITNYHDTLDSEELVFQTSEAAEHNNTDASGSRTKVENLSSLFLQEFYKKIKYSLTPDLQNKNFVPELNVGNFIKEARTLYQSKGTEESFRILFNVLFGETPKIINLEDFLAKPSSANYIRRLVVVSDVISGNALNLEGQTLTKTTDSNTTASISEVEIIKRKNKIYYKLLLFVGYDNSFEPITGKFDITGSTKNIESASAGDSTITVDSTIGFPESGTIFVGDNIITYTSKSINQFFNCEGITSEIPVASIIFSNETYYGYENGDPDKKVELRITGVLSDYVPIETNSALSVGEKIGVKSVGKIIDNSSSNRNYKQIFANSWIYNTSSRYEIIEDFTPGNTNQIILKSSIDKSSLKIGDVVELLYRDEQEVIKTDLLVENIDGNEITLNNFVTLSNNFNYDIRRKIKNASSLNVNLEFDRITSDIQNVYDGNDSYMYVASNSFPSYTIEKSLYSYIASDTDGLNSELELYSQIIFDSKISFLTGSEIYYKPSANPIYGLKEGIYYVEVLSQESYDKIRLYASKAAVGTQNYLNFGSLTLGDHTFVLSSQKEQILSPQKILRKFPLNVNIGDGKSDETPVGSTGILINGVEIYNYKSTNKIYYGPLQKINILNKGKNYDVINPPVLSPSYGSALLQPVVSGSIEKVYLDPQDFDIDVVVSIAITGGNGSGSVFQPVFERRRREIDFDANLSSAGGGVNITSETITFLTDHNLIDGQEVIYRSMGNDSVGIGEFLGSNTYSGLTLKDESSYYVKFVNNKTIRLYASIDDYKVGINTIGFTASYASGIQKFATTIKNTLSEIKVINGGTGYTNRKLRVLQSGISTISNSVYFPNHGFNDGEIITYSFTENSISGLSTTNQYYVLKVDENTFKLADAGIGATIISNYQRKKVINLQSAGSGYHIFNYPDISLKINYSSVGLSTDQIKGVINATPVVRGSIIDAYIYDGSSDYGSTILNYHKKPNIIVKNGKDAQCKPIITNGKITDVSVQFGGSEYYSDPDINVIDLSGGGRGAVLKPIIVNNKLTDVVVINPGIGYSKNTTFLEVISSGKNAIFDAHVRDLAVNNNVLFNDVNNTNPESAEIITSSYNNLQYFVSGYSGYLQQQLNDNGNKHSPIIGWAYDGNPIYGSYGYSDPKDLDSDVKRLSSGYSLNANNVINRPSTDKFIPGFFIDDYQFTNSGDLDEYNGRFCVTVEFPNGVYAYFAPTKINFEDNIVGVFPYFIGNRYRSKFINENKKLNQSFDFNSSSLIRNTFPYKVKDNTASNDFIVESNEVFSQLSEVESVTTGSIEDYEIVNAGQNYKVNDSIVFDESKSEGGGFFGKVSEISGVKIVDIQNTSLTYNNATFIWNDKNEIKVKIYPYHDLNNLDTIYASGFSTSLNYLNGFHKIGVSTNTSVLIKNIPSTLSGIVTDIYVSNIPQNVSIGSSIKIGQNVLSILNIFPSENVIKVKSGTILGLHTASTPIYFIPDTFTINKSVNSFDSKINDLVYFNPKNSVGVGTTSGISIEVTYNVGIQTNNKISLQTQAIYLPNHTFKTGQEIQLKIPSTSPSYYFSVKNVPSGASFSIPYSGDSQTLYVIKKSNNYIGIVTQVGLTTSTNGLYFSNNGENDYEYLIQSNFAQINSTVQKNKSTISVSTSHNLNDGDIINLSIKPNLSVGIGTSTSIKVLRDQNTGYLLFNPLHFNSSNVNTSRNTITIISHQLKTSDKIKYTANTVISGLSNEFYFVYKVDDNTIKLSETYVDTKLSPPNTITFGSSGGSIQTISSVNPPVSIIKNNDLVFNLSDSSLLNYNFKIFYDQNFSDEFVSTGSTTIFSTIGVGTVGLSTNASLKLISNNDLPTSLFYNLERSGYISTCDKEVDNYNRINFIDSFYNGSYTISGCEETTFDVCLVYSPEKNYYNYSECDELKYTTSSSSAHGEISKIKIISPGSNFKSLPIFKTVESVTGTGAYILPKSKDIGKIKQIRILNEGFEYSSDKTLRPEALLSKFVSTKNSNTINSIVVEDGGRYYISSPDIVLVDSDSKQKIDSGSFTVVMNASYSSIQSIKIDVEPKGLSESPVLIRTINNTNGIGIVTANSSSSGIVTCYLSTPSSGFSIEPFAIGDKIFVEGIQKVENSGDGFNSEDYGYEFFEVIDYEASTNSSSAILRYSLSNLTENIGTLQGIQNNYGTIINYKNYPKLTAVQRFSDFIIGETLEVKIQNQFINYDLKIIDSNTNYIKVFGSYDLEYGQVIRGSQSGTIATINDIKQSYGEFSINYSSLSNIGWYDNVGKLNDDIQVISDNDYYQNLSYSIKSTQEWEDIISPVNNILHPSGLKNFSDTQIVKSYNTNSISVDPDQLLESIVNIEETNRVDTINNFDLSVDYENSLINSSKFLKFKNKRLSDYFKCTTNRVLGIDDISSQFSSSEQEIDTELKVSEILLDRQFNRYLVQVSDKNFSEFQLTELIILNNGLEFFTLEKGTVDTKSSVETGYDANSIGDFYGNSFESSGKGYLTFNPKNPYTTSYNIKYLNNTFVNSITGSGTSSIGFVDLIGITSTVSSNSSFNIIQKSITNLKSLHSQIHVIDDITKEMNYVELFVDHDGTNTNLSEFYFDSENGLSSNFIGSFGASINGSGILSLTYTNTSNNRVIIKSKNIGFGTTSIGQGSYTFKQNGQIEGYENTIKYDSLYSNVSSASSIISLDNTKFSSVKSTIKVSIGNTSALHQVMMVSNGTDVYTTQYPFLSVGTESGIGTFGGEITGSQLLLNFYPDQDFSGNFEILSFNESFYKENDYQNIPTPLLYSNILESVGVSEYLALNNELNRTKFTLKYEGTPIFAKTFNPFDSSTLNPSTGEFNIKNHFFNTGEELIYRPNSTFVGLAASAVGIGSTLNYIGIVTDILPEKVYAIKIDNEKFKIATREEYANSGISVTFTSLGSGNLHEFEMVKKSEKCIITINNMVQEPIAYTLINHNIDNGTNVGTSTTIFGLSGISSIKIGDILKVDDEYMEVTNVGLGTTYSGPITFSGEIPLVSVNRGFVGTYATSHSNSGIASVYKGSFNIVGSDIYFTEAPRGVLADRVIDSLDGLPYSRDYFGGRVFLKKKYNDNKIYDNISNKFTGIGQTYTLTLNGSNNIGTGISESSGIVFINGIFQTPTTENNPNNNFIIQNDNISGITSVVFSGITSSNGSIVISQSDVNLNQLPRGGLILSLGSDGGLGYAPLVGASVTAIVAGGVITELGIGTSGELNAGNWGSGYRSPVSVAVTESGHSGVEASIVATVGYGGTLSFSIIDGGTGYVNPTINISAPSYSNLPVTGVSRLGIGSTSDCGLGLLLDIDVGASSTTGIGSTLFEVTGFKIKRSGYGFKPGDVIKPVGLVTAYGLSDPITEFKLTVLDTFTDSFSAWQFGQIDYIDSVKKYQDGRRTRYPLYYNGELLSFEQDKSDPDSQLIDFNYLLIIFINGILQKPGESYQFNGGTSFTFTDPPKTEDKVSIYFYRGSYEDSSQVSVKETIKIGDDVQLFSSNNYLNSTTTQDSRIVYDIVSSDVIETNSYINQGINFDIYRPISWTKQKTDRIFNGYFVSKSRNSIESQIYPTAKIIKNFNTTDKTIFIDNISLFNYENVPLNEIDFDALIVTESGVTTPAEITATVSGIGTVETLTIENPGNGYVGPSLSISISAPSKIGVGVGTTATASVSIVNGSISTVTIINPGFGYNPEHPPQILIPSPDPVYEKITNITGIAGSFGIIVGIGTTVGVGTNLAINFKLNTSGTISQSGISTGNPIYIFNTRVGGGVTSIISSDSDIVGVGTSFLDNIYIVSGIDNTTGVITCNIHSQSSIVGIATTGSVVNNGVGNFSWGKISDFSRASNPISIGVSGLTIDSELTSFPTLQRRGYGFGNIGPIEKNL